MVNLLENADHYGGGATTVGVRTGRRWSASRSRSTTPDRGSTGRAEPLFERFYRGSAAGRRGAGRGTGLGLALVAEHMRVMHGSVRVDTSPEGGARFVLTLTSLARSDDSDSDELEDGGSGEDEART